MSIIISHLSVGESIICGAWSLHEVLEETHAEVSHVESNSPCHSVNVRYTLIEHIRSACAALRCRVVAFIVRCY